MYEVKEVQLISDKDIMEYIDAAMDNNAKFEIEHIK